MPPDEPPEEDAPELEDVDAPPSSPVPESSPEPPGLPLLVPCPPELLEFEPFEPDDELPPGDDPPDEPDDELLPPSVLAPFVLPLLSVPLPALAPHATMATHEKKRIHCEPASRILMNGFLLADGHPVPTGGSISQARTNLYLSRPRAQPRIDRAPSPRVSARDEGVAPNDMTASVHGR
jgi:hypothetical protein